LALFAASVLAGPQIDTWSTENGARVMFVRADELPMVDIRVVFDAGSARDGGRAGLAMLTNSLLNEGAGGWTPQEIALRFERLGAEFGSGAERDMAWASLRTLVEPDVLGPALEVFSVVLSLPDFPAEEVERQRATMSVGVRQSDQSPGSVAQKMFYHAIYGDHPYAHYTGGTEESLKEIERSEIVDFYRRYYAARNALVVMVGDLDRDRAERIANRLTQGLSPGDAAQTLPDVPALRSEKREERAFPSTQTHIHLGQPGIKRGDPDHFPIYVGNHILGGSGLVSELMDEVREKRGLSYSVYSYFLPMSAPGPFIMGAQTKNASAHEALSVMKDTLARFMRDGPSEEQLTAAKKNITGGFPLRISSNRKILDYIAMIGFYGLPLNYLDTFNANVNAVTAEDIRDAFLRRVDPERLVTVIVGGGDAQPVSN